MARSLLALRNLNIAAAVIFAFALSAPAAAEIRNVAEAFDVAGDMSVLSQRIVKDYCQIGLGVSERKAKEDLAEVINRFDTEITDMRAYSPNQTITEALNAVESQWRTVKAIAIEEVQRSRAETLRSEADVLLDATEALVHAVVDEARTEAAELAHAAEFQGMLSMRIASLQFLKGWGFTDPKYQEDYENAVAQFDFSLQEIKAAEGNSAEIKKTLRAVEKQYKRLLSGTGAGTGKFILGMVSRSADKLLKLTHDVAVMYEEQF